MAFPWNAMAIKYKSRQEVPHLVRLTSYSCTFFDADSGYSEKSECYDLPITRITNSDAPPLSYGKYSWDLCH